MVLVCCQGLLVLEFTSVTAEPISSRISKYGLSVSRVTIPIIQSVGIVLVCQLKITQLKLAKNLERPMMMPGRILLSSSNDLDLALTGLKRSLRLTLSTTNGLNGYLQNFTNTTWLIRRNNLSGGAKPTILCWLMSKSRPVNVGAAAIR